MGADTDGAAGGVAKIDLVLPASESLAQRVVVERPDAVGVGAGGWEQIGRGRPAPGDLGLLGADGVSRPGGDGDELLGGDLGVDET